MNTVPHGWILSSLPCTADSEPITSLAALARAYQQVEGGDCSLSTCEDVPGTL